MLNSEEDWLLPGKTGNEYDRISDQEKKDKNKARKLAWVRS